MGSTFQHKRLGTSKIFPWFGNFQIHPRKFLVSTKILFGLLQDIGLFSAKPTSTPMDPTIDLHAKPTNIFPDAAQFRRLIVKLIYLTHSRSDIYFSMFRLSQFLAAPTTTHFNVALHIILYLKNSPVAGLFFNNFATRTHIDLIDADWESCKLTQRSTTDFCFYLGSSLIS